MVFNWTKVHSNKLRFSRKDLEIFPCPQLCFSLPHNIRIPINHPVYWKVGRFFSWRSLPYHLWPSWWLWSDTAQLFWGPLFSHPNFGWLGWSHQRQVVRFYRAPVQEGEMNVTWWVVKMKVTGSFPVSKCPVYPVDGLRKGSYWFIEKQ